MEVMWFRGVEENESGKVSALTSRSPPVRATQVEVPILIA